MSRSLIECNKGAGWEQAAPWLSGLAVSIALFIGVVLSGRPTEKPPVVEPIQFAESVVLPPPPPVERETPPVTPIPMTPVKIDFHSQHSKESIALLDVNIRPEKDQQILNKLNLDLDSFQVTMDDVNDFFVYNKSDVDTLPTAVHQPFPTIPKKLRSEKERWVRVMYYVDENGRVQNPYIIGTSHPELNELVLNALLTWRFRPPVKNGRNVRCWIRQKIYLSGQSASPFSI